MILSKLKAKFSKPNPHLSDNIKEMGLSLRTYYTLRRAGIATVGDLTEMSWDNISSIRGIVRRSIVEVEGMLEGMGLKLREEE